MKFLVLMCLFIVHYGLSQTDQGLVKSVTSTLEQVSKGPLPFECDESINQSVGSGTLDNIDGKKFPVSLISEEYLNEIFKWLASQKDIPFNYLKEGCFARAHKMSMLLEELGIASAKVVLEGDLMVPSKTSKSGYINWRYHTALVVKVKRNNKEEIMIIDPSLFDRPVPIKDWVKEQTTYTFGNRDPYFMPRFNYQPKTRKLLQTKYKDEDTKHMSNVLKTLSKLKPEQDPPKYK